MMMYVFLKYFYFGVLIQDVGFLVAFNSVEYAEIWLIALDKWDPIF